MLQLIVGSDQEFFNEQTGEFINIKPQKLMLEHSLLSISKWEAKWKKPFFAEEEMSPIMFRDYIRCMTVTPNVNPLQYECLTYKDLKAIKDYMQDTMTATKIRNMNSKKSQRTLTSELVYYWMFALGIPIECEKWHFNRLMTLIEVASIESNPKKKKMGRRDIYAQNAELNRQRRALYHTKG
jgi:hypothetical protein